MNDDALQRRARTLFDAGRLDAAATLYRRLVGRRPDDPAMHFHLGRSLHEAGRLSAATDAYRRALARDGGLAQAWVNLGQALTDRGDLAAAGRCFAGAEEIGGGAPAGGGEIAGAVRRARGAATPPLGAEGLPPWRGEALAGQRLMIFSNHGVGDAIERVRHVAMTAQRGADPVLVCPPELVALFATSGLARTIVGAGGPLPQCDRIAPLSALAHLLYGDAGTPVPEVPYLATEPAKTADWKTRRITGDGLAVGLVWAGNPAHLRDRMRSLPFALLDALLSLPGIRFYSLQTGRRADDALDRPSCVPLAPHFGDFSDTAAAVTALDLVISVDTAVAHLAGALARPLWVLLPRHADNRWAGPSGRPTPYPTARVFRQRRQGEWGPLIDRLATALRDLAAGRVRRRSAPLVTEASAPPAPASDTAALVDEGGVRLKRCRHGLMLYPVADPLVGRCLDAYGEFAEGTIALFRQMLAPGRVVVDVGAHVGAHTVFLARAVGDGGRVVAFEPRRPLFQMLCANLALNGLANVDARRAAVGASPGRRRLPDLDLGLSDDFGGVALAGMATEEGTGPRDDAAAVEVATIDGLGLAGCHVIKVGTAWAALDVVGGATQTIGRLRPQLYLANHRRDRSPDLLRRIADLGYRAYWHRPPAWRKGNFFGAAADVTGAAAALAVLCLAGEAAQAISGLREVEAPDDWPPDA